MTNISDRVLVIVPAWNEADSVGQTVQRILAADPNFDVVVVNDGSTDETEAIAAGAGATVLTLPFNLGVGGAMRTGFIYARRNGYRRAIQVDADGQHDPPDIARVIDGLDRADIAIGARFADVGTYTVRGPRRWAMIVLAEDALAARGHAAHRCHQWVPRRERARDRAVHAVLPGRVPR